MILWEKIWQNPPWSLGGYYHRWLSRTYKFIIPKGSRVLELGCGGGDLLASLEPEYGVGIDFSASAIQKARSVHPQLRFEVIDVEALELDAEDFDFIITIPCYDEYNYIFCNRITLLYFLHCLYVYESEKETNTVRGSI